MPQVESPSNHVRSIAVIHAIAFVVIDGQDGVRLVCASYIDLKSGYNLVSRYVR